MARAAFEEALNYAKTRVQGGKPLIEYTTIQTKLFHMLRKVETSRAISRGLIGMAAPPPAAVTFLTGQPKFRSRWSTAPSAVSPRNT